MPDAYDSTEPNTPGLGAALRALPLVAPRESALPGLMVELAARRRRRALGWLAPIAAAAAAAVLVLMLAPRGTPPDPRAGPAMVATTAPAASAADAELARLMQANARLEQRLSSVRSAHITQDGDAAQASAQMEDMLLVVDAALGADPPPDRRRMLWQRRLELLEALNQVQGRGSFAPAANDNGSVRLASF